MLSRTAFRAALALTVVCAAPLAAQTRAGSRATITTSSEEARAELAAALDDWANIVFGRAAQRADRALALDSMQPIARVIRAQLAPGLTAEQRRAEADRAVASAAHASAEEQLFARAVQERRHDRLEASKILIDSLAALNPEEPLYGWLASNWTPDAGQRREALQALIQRFPDFPPAHNNLAYELWNAGDREGGVVHARHYLDLLPDHPNALDTYAEFMQWTKQYDESERAYRRAFEADPSFLEARIGLSEVQLLQGRADDARRTLEDAMAVTRNPALYANLQRRMAMTHLYEGRAERAIPIFARVAEEGFGARQAEAARGDYLTAAILAASHGDERGARRFLEQAGGLRADHPAAPISAALANPADPAVIHHAISQLESFAYSGNAPARTADDLRVARLLLALASSELATARTLAGEVENASARQIAWALVGEKLKTGGQRQEAARIRAEIVDNPIFSVTGMIARAKALRL